MMRFSGEWEAPMIDNPEYKGEWTVKRISNPAYKGVWEAKKIANPEFVDTWRVVIPLPLSTATKPCRVMDRMIESH